MKMEFTSQSEQELIKLIQQNSSLNFNQIKAILRKKDVKVNGKKVSQNLLVSASDFVQVFYNLKQKQIDVMYQDENVVVVNKPVGVEVKTADIKTDEKSLEQLTNAMAVHRLDRNTSGVTILAKNLESMQQLEQAFKSHLVQKTYMCVVVGTPKQQSKKLVAYLLKDSQKSIVKIFDKKVENSTQIKTNYKLIKTNGELSLLQVEILTGKTHQIRAHLAHENLCVLGDEKYGNKAKNKEYGVHRQLLVATQLSFNFAPNSKLFYLNDKVFKISPNFDKVDI